MVTGTSTDDPDNVTFFHDPDSYIVPVLVSLKHPSKLKSDYIRTPTQPNLPETHFQT